MTPAARIKATIELLEKIEQANIPMDLICGDYFRFRRYVGSKDRADIVERVYAIARAKSKLSWWLDKYVLEQKARNYVLVWLAINDERNIKNLFSGEKYAPESLTESEIKIIQSVKDESAGNINHKDMDIPVLYEFNRRYYDIFKSLYGDNLEKELQAMLNPASLDLRVNISKADLNKVIAMLEADNIKTERMRYSPYGLRCLSKAYLSKSKAFSKGLIEIQDEGSQIISLVAGVMPGNQVLDYCAGAGGKTLALASAMNNKGRIVAMDIDSKRLEKGKQRFKRAAISDIIETRSLEDAKQRKWLRRQKGTFDVVLTDVPCSGSGTWRRNPDMRWNTYGPSLEELIETQSEILENVAHCVKSGGRLVYSTCSLLPDENEKQIEKFLENHKDFEQLSIKQIWNYETLCPNEEEEPKYLRLTPYKNGTDGFFVAVLKRN